MIIKDIRVRLYKHLLKLRLKFFDNTPIGRLVTRNVSDVETLADVFSEGLAAIIGDLLQIVTILAMMFYIDWKLTLVSLSTLPLLIISTYVFKEKIKVTFNDVRNAVSNLNSFLFPFPLASSGFAFVLLILFRRLRSNFFIHFNYIQS